jgi:uncharacterized protein (TIGR02246 family)
MESYLLPGALISLMLLMAACQPGSEQREAAKRAEDVAAIKRLVGPEWATAWIAGDTAAVADFYAEDAILLPQNHPPVVGKKAIQSGYQSFFDQFSIKGSSEILELEVAGDWGFMRGTYTTVVTPKAGGKPIEEDRGNWLWIVRRQPDGAWKISRAVGASEPLPGGGRPGSS